MQTSYKATGVLAVCAAGAAVTTMFGNGGFFGGMLQHGFLAATIGGLADWFAVTAVFRKPLGIISYRTEILRRNRPRIMQALNDFISEDLLSKENIMETLRKQDFAEMFAAYLTQRGGRDRIWALLQEFAVRAAEGIRPEVMVRPLASMVREDLESFDGRPLLRGGMEAFKSETLQERLAASMIPVLRGIFIDASVQQDILSHICAMRESYEAASSKRAAVFEMANLTDEKILEHVNVHINEWLNGLATGEGEAHDGMMRIAGMMISYLTASEEFYNAAQQKFHDKIDGIDFEARAEERVQLLLKDNIPIVLELLRDYMDKWIERFLSERELRGKMNSWMLSVIEQALEKNHAIIPQMIAEQLEKLSDDALVEMAESRVADDLQMIRINGSLIGAFVGMGLYVIVRAVEGVCG